jgi:hypothetical protein
MRRHAGEALWDATNREADTFAQRFERRMREDDAPIQEALIVLATIVAKVCSGTASHHLSEALWLSDMCAHGVKMAIKDMCVPDDGHD